MCVWLATRVEVMNTTAAPVATQDANDHEHSRLAETLASVALTLVMIFWIYRCWKWLKRCCATRRNYQYVVSPHVRQSQNSTTPPPPIVPGFHVVTGVPVGVPGSDGVPYAEEPAIRPELRFVSPSLATYDNKMVQDKIKQTIADIKLELKNVKTDTNWVCDEKQFEEFVNRHVQKKPQYVKYYNEAISRIFDDIAQIAKISDAQGHSMLTSQAYFEWLNP